LSVAEVWPRAASRRIEVGMRICQAGQEVATAAVNNRRAIRHWHLPDRPNNGNAAVPDDDRLAGVDALAIHWDHSDVHEGHCSGRLLRCGRRLLC